MSKFKSVVTTLGQARIASAIESGRDVSITHMAVGDGNGNATEPSKSQTALIHETYRLQLNSIKIDNKNANWIIAEAIIPASVGGFWMREMGLFSADGELIAVSNMADSYKPTLEEGSGRTQTLRMVLTVTDTNAISLTIDDTLIIATEEYVNDMLAAHEQSRNHPDGTLTAKGFVQLNSAVNSASETLAATPKAVKTANDNANSRLPADGTAVAATKLATARKIAGVAFDGTADISIPPGNVGALPVSGTAVAATKLATARNIAGVAFDGSKDIALTGSNVGLGNVGNYQAVQAGGGLNYIESHRIYLDWGKGDNLYATVDNTNLGVLYTGKKPPTAAEVGAFPVNGGSVNGRVFANYFGCNTVAWPTAQGSYIGWNESNSQGESNFVNNKGGGPGGFVFRTVNVSNTAETGRVDISGTGNLNTSGTLSEQGQRVYSPNNRPTSADVNAITRDNCDAAGFVSGNISTPYLRHTPSGAIVGMATRDLVSAENSATRNWANNDLRNDVYNWTRTQFVTGQRQASAQWSGPVGGGLQVPAGCVVIGAKNNGSSDVARMGLLYAAEQICINGNWMTIGLA